MFVYVIDVGTSSMRGILYNERAEVLMKHSWRKTLRTGGTGFWFF